MLFNPIRLKSPSGQNLEIQLETHVYTQEDYQKGVRVLQDKELVGFESVNLTQPEIYVLKAMYFVALSITSLFKLVGRSIASLFSGKKFYIDVDEPKFPNIRDMALCASLEKGNKVPLDPAKVKQTICSSYLDSNFPPELPSLKKVGRLESDLSPLGRFFLLCLDARFCAFLGMTVLWSVSRISGQKLLWEFAKNKIHKFSEKAFNPFAWPRYFWERRHLPLSGWRQQLWSGAELVPYYLILGYELVFARNDGMARSTDRIVQENHYDNNMIVVGMFHKGIADILVENYGYQRVK